MINVYEDVCKMEKQLNDYKQGGNPIKFKSIPEENNELYDENSFDPADEDKIIPFYNIQVITDKSSASKIIIAPEIIYDEDKAKELFVLSTTPTKGTSTNLCHIPKEFCEISKVSTPKRKKKQILKVEDIQHKKRTRCSWNSLIGRLTVDTHCSAIRAYQV